MMEIEKYRDFYRMIKTTDDVNFIIKLSFEMSPPLIIDQICEKLEKGVNTVRSLTKEFCSTLDITTFGYVRIYHNRSVSWVTSNPDQDRLLLEAGSLDSEPLFNTPEALKEGHYLWFNDRKFPGSETFYEERARRFHLDHGLIVVKHRKNYVETCCFSGLLAKRPLYNIFMKEKALFSAFMDNFAKQFKSSHLLEEGVDISHFKSVVAHPSSLEIDRATLLKTCNWQKLLKLSKQEKNCLLLLRQGLTYQVIALKLKLSPRTVEHYIISIKNKLSVESRSDLFLAAGLLEPWEGV